MIPLIQWLATGATGVRKTRELNVDLPAGNTLEAVRLFATEGAIAAPSRAQVAALPCCQAGANPRWSVDDAWAMIKSTINSASVSVDSGGSLRLGHPQTIYGVGGASARQAAAQRVVAQLNQEATPSYSRALAIVQAQGEVIAQYGAVMSGAEFVAAVDPTRVVTFANGALASNRTAASTSYCLPDGWLLIHKTVREEDGSPNTTRITWLVWCGPGRGGYELNRFNGDDNTVPSWSWTRPMYCPTVGVDDPQQWSGYPGLIPTSAVAALWAADVRALPRQMATGWGPGVTLDLYVHGMTTLPTGAVTLGGANPPEDWQHWLAWASRPVSVSDVPGDKTVAVTSAALARYYVHTLERQDRQPGPTVTSGWRDSVDRLGVMGAVFLLQHNDSGRVVKRLQDVDVFSQLGGDDIVLPENNARPAVTATQFNTKYRGTTAHKVMQTVQLGPGLGDIIATPLSNGGWAFQSAAEHVYPATLSPADRDDLLALVGDVIIQVSSSLRTRLRAWLTAQGLAVLTDQVHTRPQESGNTADFWLLPSFTGCNDSDFHTAYLAGGAELSQDTVHTIQALREGEMALANEYYRLAGVSSPWNPGQQF